MYVAHVYAHIIMHVCAIRGLLHVCCTCICTHNNACMCDQGFVVTPAMDGEEALQLLASRDYLPDVVLLDCQMPKKTGFEVCEELRR